MRWHLIYFVQQTDQKCSVDNIVLCIWCCLATAVQSGYVWWMKPRTNCCRRVWLRLLPPGNVWIGLGCAHVHASLLFNDSVAPVVLLLHINSLRNVLVISVQAQRLVKEKLQDTLISMAQEQVSADHKRLDGVRFGCVTQPTVIS